MATFLFDKTIFGPVYSRRLGTSLGINLLPNNSKVCSFSCIYCECGWSSGNKVESSALPSREEVKILLRKQLEDMLEKSNPPDVITFAGNGEPTLHPDFLGIVEDTIKVRNKLFPKARIAVLSNSTMLHKQDVVNALKKVDDNILKFDSVFPKTIQLLDCPADNFNLNTTIENLKKFKKTQIIQVMLVKGEYKGQIVDNTTEKELAGLIEALKDIRPRQIMIYTIERDTPAKNLHKVPPEELKQIATRFEKELDIPVQVSV